MNLRFQGLTETFKVSVHRAECRTLNVPLIAPFTIASSRLDAVKNVAIRLELRDGSVGWGEAPVLPFVTVEDQEMAIKKSKEACELLLRASPTTLMLALKQLGDLLPGHECASVRAGMEMALIDAAANSIHEPLWRIFGGFSDTIITDITIPVVPPAEAAELAEKYATQGFTNLKVKVGKHLRDDIEVLRAVQVAHPNSSLILDANEGYTSNEAIDMLDKLHELGMTPVLLEQPVSKDDWKGLHEVYTVAKNKYGVSVAADESCRSLCDVHKIIAGNIVDVINIKLAKFGVTGALEVIEAARKAGIQLMIGGMVETRIAMGFAGNLAAGLGCFRFIDLDTPILLAEDPVVGGYEVSGAVYKFTSRSGSGHSLEWDLFLWRLTLTSIRVDSLNASQSTC